MAIKNLVNKRAKILKVILVKRYLILISLIKFRVKAIAKEVKSDGNNREQQQIISLKT